MMNPDQMYVLRQLQLHDLRVEAEQARATENLLDHRAARGRFAAWLHSVGLRVAQRHLQKAFSYQPPK